MMMQLTIAGITFIAISLGLYLILVEQMKLADRSVKKTARSFQGHSNKGSSFDDFIDKQANRLAKHIPMDPYRRMKLAAELKSLNMTIAPEQYRARIIIQAGFVFMLALLSLFVIPVTSIALFALGIVLYFKGENELKEKLQKKREEIQNELPRFACTLTQELKTSRDVLTILASYKKNAGASMKEELEITVADMRSGNYEAALLRFEGRISIAALSDIVRGLIGVLRGDNNVGYFEMLSHDLDVIEVQRLENIAMKQPGKIKKYLFLLLVCTLLMYLTILGVYAMTMTGV
jgi:Flp pilus assembly protein TadB